MEHEVKDFLVVFLDSVDAFSDLSSEVFIDVLAIEDM